MDITFLWSVCCYFSSTVIIKRVILNCLQKTVVPVELLKAFVFLRKSLLADTMEPHKADLMALLTLNYVCKYWNKLLSKNEERMEIVNNG